MEEDPTTVVRCVDEAFQDHGVVVDRKMIEDNRGREKLSMISDIVAHMKLDPVLISKVYESFRHHFKSNLHHFTPQDDASDIFGWLKSRNVRIGIGTGLPPDLLEMILNQVSWSKDLFDFVGYPTNSIRGRPHPDMIHAMMNKLAITSTREILKVGDTVSDIEEGKNAGAQTAVLLSTSQPHALLIAAKPDFALSSLSELRKIFDH